MKKIVVFLLCFVLLSCSQKTNISESDYMYFVFATPLKKHEIWLKAKTGFLDACEELEIHCDWLGPSIIDTNNMNEVIDVAISQKADAFITQGVVSQDILDKAAANKIPFALVDSDMTQSQRLVYYGKNFKEQAQLFLTDIEKKVGRSKHLNIAIQVAELDFEIAQKQIEEIRNVFDSHDGGYTIHAITESKSDSVRAKREWTTALKENNIDIAINFAGESVISCGQVARELEIRNEILIYGVDDIPQTIQGIEEGLVDGTIYTSFYHYGYDSVMRLYEYLKEGESVENPVQGAKLMLVTLENLQEYKKEQR